MATEAPHPEQKRREATTDVACHRSVGGGCVRASLASTAAKLTPRGARSDPMPLPNPRTKCRFARGNAAHGRLSAPLARRHMLQLHTRSCAGLVSSSLATSISAPPQRHRPTAAGRQRCGRPPLGAGGAADGKSAISPTSDLTSPHLTHCFLLSLGAMARTAPTNLPFPCMVAFSTDHSTGRRGCRRRGSRMWRPRVQSQCSPHAQIACRSARRRAAARRGHRGVAGARARRLQARPRGQASHTGESVGGVAEA